jgi:hypothetical protein
MYCSRVSNKHDEYGGLNFLIGSESSIMGVCTIQYVTL